MRLRLDLLSLLAAAACGAPDPAPEGRTVDPLALETAGADCPMLVTEVAAGADITVSWEGMTEDRDGNPIDVLPAGDEAGVILLTVPVSAADAVANCADLVGPGLIAADENGILPGSTVDVGEGAHYVVVPAAVQSTAGGADLLKISGRDLRVNILLLPSASATEHLVEL